MAGVKFGYTLMTEQSGPKQLVSYAAAAERAGFDFEVSSDHYLALVESVRPYWEAGFTDIALVQIGDETQHEFLTTLAEPLLERLRAACGA